MRGTRAWGVGVMVVLLGCGSGETSSSSGSTGGAGGATASESGGVGGTGGVGVTGGQGGVGGTTSTPECEPPACPTGEAPGPSGSCEPAGIQGCAAKFIDADGVCRPSMAKCADQPGTIPRFTEGCVPVGIPDCAPDFLEDDGFCHPAMKKCPDGTYAVPQEGCVPIDGPEGCGDGTWGAIPDSPGTLYVDPAFGGPVSDGTKDMPYKSVGSAMVAAPAGAILALAAGVYPAVTITTKPVSLVGRCPSMTKIEPLNPTQAGIFVLGVSGVSIRGLTITHAWPGIHAKMASAVTIEGVHLTETMGNGILAWTSDVTAEHVLVTDLVPYQYPGNNWASASGMLAYEGGTGVFRHGAVLRAVDRGVESFKPGSSLTVEDSLVEGTLPDPISGLDGLGALLSQGASITLDGVAMVDNRAAGVLGFDVGTTVTMTHSHVEGTQPEVYSGLGGCGVSAQVGAHFSVAGSTFLRNTYNGLLAHSKAERAILTSQGNLVAWTEFPTPSRFGIGAVVQDKADGSFVDDVFFENHTAGMFLYAGDATATLDHVLIEGTQPSPDSGQDGGGILAYLSGPLTVNSSAIVNNNVGALGLVINSGTVTHSLFGHTKSGSIKDEQGVIHQDFGDGLLAHLGDMTVETSIIELNARAGVLYSSSSGLLRWCEIRDNQYGVVLQGGSTVTFDPTTCSISGDCDGAVVSDGDLAVPTGLTDL